MKGMKASWPGFMPPKCIKNLKNGLINTRSNTKNSSPDIHVNDVDPPSIIGIKLHRSSQPYGTGHNRLYRTNQPVYGESKLLYYCCGRISQWVLAVPVPLAWTECLSDLYTTTCHTWWMAGSKTCQQ